MTEQKTLRIGLNALQLKILAMIFMVMDHAWATLPIQGEWLTCVGRLAFPIFAFQIAEGYVHTRDAKAYRRRLLLWAIITEIPFNFMTAGGFINPFHQNVLFTFCLALFVMERVDRTRGRSGLLGWVLAAGWLLVGYVLGFVTFLDYYGYGVLICVMFFLCRNSKLAQFAFMLFLNVFWMKGLGYPVTLLGMEMFIPQQAFAMLSLILIWLYNGEQGPYNKTIRRACYAFYPGHIAVLAVLAQFIFR